MQFKASLSSNGVVVEVDEICIFFFGILVHTTQPPGGVSDFVAIDKTNAGQHHSFAGGAQSEKHIQCAHHVSNNS